MSSKKRYIPIVALGALLLSLLAILPVAGAGEVTFIVPGDIEDDNSGTLSDTTPDDQTSARQGGQVGILYEDDDLSRPIRRALVIGWDTDEASGSARPDIVQHSKVLKNMELKDWHGVNPGDQLLEAGDYVYVGEQPDLDDTAHRTVRKVVSVVQTADTIEMTDLTDKRFDVTLDAAFPEDESSLRVHRIRDSVGDAYEDFSDDYQDFSLAEQFTAAAGSLERINASAAIVPSNIADEVTNGGQIGARTGGQLDTRLSEDDVLIFERGDTDSLTPADQVQANGRIDIDSGDALTASTVYMLVYWAAVRNNTGSDLTVQSQSVRPQPITLHESSDSTGNFAAKIDLIPATLTVPWNDIPVTSSGTPPALDQEVGSTVTLTATHQGYSNLMVKVPRGWTDSLANDATALVETVPDFSTDIPRLPVNERDTVTVNYPDGSESLRVETTKPIFSNFGPAHNSTGDDSRPTVSAQVTDGDSGLKESNIGVIFANSAGGSSVSELIVKVGDDADADSVAGGYEVSARLGSTEDLSADGEIWWWVYAKDNAGNVAYSDRLDKTSSGADDACDVTTVAGQSQTSAAAHANLLQDAQNDNKCDPYVIKVDSTDPKIHHAETGRWWDTSLSTGDSDDKTEYRTSKANRSSVLLIFNEGLDPATVQASDFEVNDSPPSSADIYNVKVRDDNVIEDDEDTEQDESSGDGNDDYYNADAIPQFVGEDKGYVFLTLGQELSPNARPKVEMTGEVSDLAGNRQNALQRDAEADDRIGPKLAVTIAEGDRPVTAKDVTITITADENIGTPAVSFYKVDSHSPEDGDSVQMLGSEQTASATFVSAKEYTAKLTPSADGLYTVFVTASDSSGSNEGEIGDRTVEIDVDGETTAILFERDKNIDAPDFDPAKDGVNNSFETDDANGFIRIDYSSEADEYTSTTLAARDADPDATPPVTAREEMSGDDLDTHGRVTIVSATLDGDDISGDLNPNTNGNIFQYHLDNKPVGEYKLEMVVRDEAGNQNAAAHKGTIKIIERKPYKLTLNPGWNLVSLPGQPADTDINAVIPADHPIDAVATYDPMVPGAWLTSLESGDGTFDGTVTTIESGLAYWIRTSSFQALEVNIPKPTPGASTTLLPTIPISQGWNLVPVLDVDGDFELAEQTADDNYFSGLTSGSVAAIYTYNTVTNSWMQVTETGVALGKGYWVYATKPGVIVP